MNERLPSLVFDEEERHRLSEDLFDYYLKKIWPGPRGFRPSTLRAKASVQRRYHATITTIMGYAAIICPRLWGRTRVVGELMLEAEHRRKDRGLPDGYRRSPRRTRKMRSVLSTKQAFKVAAWLRAYAAEQGGVIKDSAGQLALMVRAKLDIKSASASNLRRVLNAIEDEVCWEAHEKRRRRRGVNQRVTDLETRLSTLEALVETLRSDLEEDDDLPQHLTRRA